MIQVKLLMLTALLLVGTLGVCQTGTKETSTNNAQAGMHYKVNKSEQEWRKVLSKEAYEVLRKKGTERAFSGKFNNHKKKGIYTCAACGQELFSSASKFDSGTGWPSYFEPIRKEAVHEERDQSHGMLRAEVLCGNCGGHLGHVFNDGPKPTGLRYCINSVAMGFVKAGE